MSRVREITQYPHWRVKAIERGGEIIHDSVHATKSDTQTDADAAQAHSGVRDVITTQEPGQP